jgi:hypothetical protein
MSKGVNPNRTYLFFGSFPHSNAAVVRTSEEEIASLTQSQAPNLAVMTRERLDVLELKDIRNKNLYVLLGVVWYLVGIPVFDFLIFASSEEVMSVGDEFHLHHTVVVSK